MAEWSPYVTSINPAGAIVTHVRGETSTHFFPLQDSHGAHWGLISIIEAWSSPPWCPMGTHIHYWGLIFRDLRIIEPLNPHFSLHNRVPMTWQALHPAVLPIKPPKTSTHWMNWKYINSHPIRPAHVYIHFRMSMIKGLQQNNSF